MVEFVHDNFPVTGYPKWSNWNPPVHTHTYKWDEKEMISMHITRAPGARLVLFFKNRNDYALFRLGCNPIEEGVVHGNID